LKEREKHRTDKTVISVFSTVEEEDQLILCGSEMFMTDEWSDRGAHTMQTVQAGVRSS